ncbi:MAG: hypothetical protein Q9181_004241 [Wetmoreana brouardii]
MRPPVKPLLVPNVCIFCSISAHFASARPTARTQRRFLRSSTAVFRPPAQAAAVHPQDDDAPSYEDVSRQTPNLGGVWAQHPPPEPESRSKSRNDLPLTPGAQTRRTAQSSFQVHMPLKGYYFRTKPLQWNCERCSGVNDFIRNNCQHCNRARVEHATQWRCPSCGWYNGRPESRCTKCNSSNADEAQLTRNAKQWKHLRRPERDVTPGMRQERNTPESMELSKRREQERRIQEDRTRRLEQTKNGRFVGFKPSKSEDNTELGSDSAQIPNKQVDTQEGAKSSKEVAAGHLLMSKHRGTREDFEQPPEKVQNVHARYQGRESSNPLRGSSTGSLAYRDTEPPPKRGQNFRVRYQENGADRSNAERISKHFIHKGESALREHQARIQANLDNLQGATARPSGDSKPTPDFDNRPTYSVPTQEPSWSQPMTSLGPNTSPHSFGSGWKPYNHVETSLTEAEKSQRPSTVAEPSIIRAEDSSSRQNTGDFPEDRIEARFRERGEAKIPRAPHQSKNSSSADISWFKTLSPRPSSPSSMNLAETAPALETLPRSRIQDRYSEYGDISWLEATSSKPSSEMLEKDRRHKAHMLERRAFRKGVQSQRKAPTTPYTPAGGTQDSSSNDVGLGPDHSNVNFEGSQPPLSTARPTPTSTFGKLVRENHREKPSRSGNTLNDIDFAPSAKAVRGASSPYHRLRGSRTPRHAQNDFDEDLDEYDDDREERRQRRKEQRKKERAIQRSSLPPTPIHLPEFISVGNLAKVLKVRVEDFAKKMQSLGFEETNNDHLLDAEVAGLIAAEFNFEPVIDTASEDQDLKARPPAEDKSVLPPRPPIVTIMGHVDHGKTTLLDYLRKSSVAASEHGGITQHIGAFSVPMPGGRLITFLDTPGHAAFLSMRQRGANVTDIVILVVAADDSVKPQTVEAIKHAQAAKVPMIVAINKIDKEDKNVERVKQDLARYGVEIEDFGGDTQVVCVSGKTGEGLDKLEDATVALADILDMRAEADGQSEGWVLEATTKKAGRVATVLVRRGTIQQGDIIVAGCTWAKIRTLKNEAGMQVSHAGPGIPVEVDGWKEQPSAGDKVLQAGSEQQAKSAVAFRLAQAEKEQMAADMTAVNESRRLEQERREASAEAAKLAPEGEGNMAAAAAAPSTLEPPSSTAPAQDSTRILRLILKADVSGSVEACVNTITSLGNATVHPQILRSSVGPISESDISLASSSEAQIVNFNQSTNPEMYSLASRMGVTFIEENIIYRLTDLVKAKLEELLPPKIETRVLGEAEVAQSFEISAGGRKKIWVAGCKVRNGVISRANKVKVLRGEEVVFDGSLTSLKNVKKDVTEMRKGSECGMGFGDWIDFRPGDQVQCYEEKEVKQVL